MSGSTFHPGQDIGGFVILKPLGKGGMAELFLARDRVLKRRVVIKVLNPVVGKRKGFRRQFLREARIQAGLDNPRIVQVLQGLEEGADLCLVMQYVQGTDLEKVIKKARALREKKGAPGALSVERSVHIFLQVLEGVGFVHKYKIIHGDIKPSNILLDRQGRAKVADFGLAFLMSYERRHGGSFFHGGTPYYMSPEQVLNQGMDFRSDIYALGVTFFHMITGRFPFGEKKRYMELVECHMEGSLDDAREILAECGEIPPRIKEAIFKALENDPEKRHQSCLEFALAIQQETSHEMYSELLRLNLLGKKEITPSERAYLDEIAAKKSLSREEARSLEENIRNEMGLPPLQA
ncbi:MAG: serine/threonine protein kinase [Deltaproteobacteria bacterium]|nr:serine/threonine protein kinase [Deltaproteobacteria bacterium]